MLQNLRKLLEESSLSLRDALGGRAYFRSVQVVVPSDWREAMCQVRKGIARKKNQPGLLQNIRDFACSYILI